MVVAHTSPMHVSHTIICVRILRRWDTHLSFWKGVGGRGVSFGHGKEEHYYYFLFFVACCRQLRKLPVRQRQLFVYLTRSYE